MKLTAFFLFVIIMQVSASTFAQKVTLKNEHITLKELFKQIRQQTGYDVLYQQEQVNTQKTISVNFNNTPLKVVMEQSLEGQPLEFTIDETTVIIKKKEQNLLDKAKAYFAQITISGKVSDETGAALPGVTVKVKGTQTATTTDNKGQYSITAPDDKATIAFSYIGYETIELTARDLQSGSNITLKASINNLKEVVVSKGYYNTTQELNTGNVVRVDGKDLTKQPVSDPIVALEGRVPGLYINQISGVTGAYPKIQLRGQNSIAQGNTPLFIVDGVQLSTTSLTNSKIGGGLLGSSFANIASGMSPFNTLDIHDIESIEVLKDADATAIYGSRGANGVILITTKRGKVGKAQVDVDISQGYESTASKLNLMNTQQYLAMRHQALSNDGVLPGPSDYDVNGTWDTTRYTDWQKVLIGKTAQFTNAAGSISGGSGGLRYNLGGKFSRETFVFPGDYTDKKSAGHINLSYNSADNKFQTQFSTSYGYDNSVLPLGNFVTSIFLAPDAPALYNADGTYNSAFDANGSATFGNPLRLTQTMASAKTSNLNSNVQLSYELLPGLTLKSSLGYTTSQQNQTNQQYGGAVTISRNATINPNVRQNKFATTNNNSIVFEPQLNFTRAVGQGKFDILLGMTQQKLDYNSISNFAYGFGNDAFVSNPAFASNYVLQSNSVSQYRYSALYARLGYNWADKYIINLTARRDGSSRFGPKNEFGNFGAVGAAWIFSKEKFADKLSWLSFGKLRASYGITGNDQIGDYQYLSTYGAYSNSYQGTNTLVPRAIANPFYGWETNKKLEGGLDLGFLKDRIYLSVDYFYNRSGNQLVGYSLPILSGFPSVIANLPAVVQNTGLELSVSSTNIQSKDFSWRTSINFTLPRNKLVSFPDLANSNYNNTYVVGQPLNIKHLYQFTGVDPQTGIYTFRDINGDGVLNNSDKITKSITQQFYGGIQNNIQYGNWNLDIFFQFVRQAGSNFWGNFARTGVQNYNNAPVELLNAWKKPGDQALVGRYQSDYTSTTVVFGAINYTASDQAYTDASFIRLKTLQLSYQLSTKIAHFIRVRNLKVYCTGQNLVTFTKYLGVDPETQDASGLPPLKTISFGLQLGL